MKLRYMMMAAAAMLALAACDKIEPDQYTVFAGAVGTWENGTHIAQPVQRVYVEKYTGPRCTNCPAADRTLAALHEQYGERLVLLSVNTKNEQFGAPYPNNPDMRVDDGAVWEDFWGVTSYPTAYINRIGEVSYRGLMGNIADGVQSMLGQQPVVAIEGSRSGDAEMTLTVNIELLQAYEAPLTLTLALTEDSLAYRQLDGSAFVNDYMHNHILRDVVTDVWGMDVDCQGTAGECRKVTLRYEPEALSANYHVVALVSDKNTRRVLNSIEL